MHRIPKRRLVIVAAVFAVVAFAGGAYAATQNSAPDSRQAFLNDVAKRLHVTPQQLSSALNGAFLDQLQAAVNAGRLTQAEANALAQRLKQKGSLAPAVPFGPFGPHMGRPGMPGRGFGPGPGFGPGFLFGGFGGGLEGAASYLGISDLQLFQQLSSGKSLAQIAAAHGKTAGGLEQAMTAATKARLDKLVADKDITAAQEKEILSRFSARLSAHVNQKGLPFRRPFLQRHPGGAPMPPQAPVPGAAAPVPFPAPTA